MRYEWYVAPKALNIPFCKNTEITEIGHPFEKNIEVICLSGDAQSTLRIFGGVDFLFAKNAEVKISKKNKNKKKSEMEERVAYKFQSHPGGWSFFPTIAVTCFLKVEATPPSSLPPNVLNNPTRQPSFPHGAPKIPRIKAENMPHSLTREASLNFIVP